MTSNRGVTIVGGGLVSYMVVASEVMGDSEVVGAFSGLWVTLSALGVASGDCVISDIMVVSVDELEVVTATVIVSVSLLELFVPLGSLSVGLSTCATRPSCSKFVFSCSLVMLADSRA